MSAPFNVDMNIRAAFNCFSCLHVRRILLETSAAMVSDLKLTDGGSVYRRRVQTRIESVIAGGAESIPLSESAADDWSVFD